MTLPFFVISFPLRLDRLGTDDSELARVVPNLGNAPGTAFDFSPDAGSRVDEYRETHIRLNDRREVDLMLSVLSAAGASVVQSEEFFRPFVRHPYARAELTTKLTTKRVDTGGQ